MKYFITDEEEQLLIAAIREQEARTSAEIRVCVTDRVVFRPKRYAWRVFERHGMRRTRYRNAALIVMMPRVKQIVMIGDSGLDTVVPDDFWERSVSAMVKSMHDHGPLASLIEGLGNLGNVLSEHWPRHNDDENELSDDILRD